MKPKRWKMILLTWICIYPILNIAFLVLGPYIGELPQMLRTLILTAIVVPLMNLALGALQKRFAKWIVK